MNIFVLNSGSSTIKCSLYDFSNFTGALLKPVWERTFEGQLEAVLQELPRNWKVDLIGHRIVHGGRKYRTSVVIDEAVKNEIRALADLAPLHNLLALAGIEALEKLFPKATQIALFDTAFHHTIPEKAKIYPGPYSWREQGIYRFGFHGISYAYCAKRAAELLGKMPQKMLICHLGSGASLCALCEGKSIDTTMGFTPLEGLMMDTRSGTVDPGLLLYLLEKKKMGVQELSNLLYENSGLLGLSGLSGDMRDILQYASQGDERALLALEVYLHRLTSLAGSMIASLGGLDVLIFTAGIGEHCPLIRKRVCEQLQFLGIEIIDAKGEKDQLLSTNKSRVQVLLIHTQEAFEIARECFGKKSSIALE